MIASRGVASSRASGNDGPAYDELVFGFAVQDGRLTNLTTLRTGLIAKQATVQRDAIAAQACATGDADPPSAPLTAESGKTGGGDDGGGGSGGGGGGGGSVSADLGGYAGIFAFLDQKVVPAELADPDIAPFFATLTETPSDIEMCLAMLLDHDLGGSSPHFGAVLADGHQCRSSMSDIHRGRNIPDAIVTKFIMIVGQQATLAGIPSSDITAVANALESYRGGVRNN